MAPRISLSSLDLTCTAQEDSLAFIGRLDRVDPRQTGVVPVTIPVQDRNLFFDMLQLVKGSTPGIPCL
jgi:hypothetical protein